MALTYAEYFSTTGSAGPGGDITSGSFTVASDDVICVLWAHGAAENVSTVSISNTGNAFTWNPITNAGSGSQAYVRGWYAKATTGQSMTVSIDNSSTIDNYSSLSVIVHTGAHATDPVPSGKIYSGGAANDASQSITPTASGSCLWMIACDWNAANALSPNANCTAESADHIDGNYTVAIIRPTTQPRTDANAFTIGEASDGTSEVTAWIAFEVQAAASSQSNAPRAVHLMKLMGAM